jgi:hypothetical protein
VGDAYLRDKATGAFAASLGQLPQLQVVAAASDGTKALAQLGQSHAIARFLA